MFHILSFLFSLSSWTLKFAHWVLEIVHHQAYSRKTCTFHFGDRHLGFLADIDVTRCRKWHHYKVWPRKHGNSRWNFVAMCSKTRDMPGGGVNTPPSCRQTSPKKLLPGQGLTKWVLALVLVSCARKISWTHSGFHSTLNFSIVNSSIEPSQRHDFPVTLSRHK